MATWVAGGIAAGLVAGGACALAGGKAALCAPIGAALLLGSLVGGYLQQKGRQASNQAELQHAVDTDSGAFGQQLGQLGVAAHNLSQCRQQQIATITEHYQAKQIDRQTAQDQLAQVEVKLGQDQELVNAFLGEANKRTDMQVKARATAANLPPEKYVAKIEQGYVQPAVTEVAVQEPPARKKAQSLPATAPISPRIFYAASRANLRTEPTSTSGVVTSVGKGTALTVNGKAGDWYATTYDGQAVFIAASLVSKNRPQVEVASLQYENMKGEEPTQKTYNMNKSVAQQTQSDLSETQRLLAQTKELLG